MTRYINIEDVTLKGVAVFDENLDILIPLSDVRKALLMTPSADVVPKSEVEELKGELAIAERHEKDARALFKDAVIQLQNARQEVAREIFEEIRERLSSIVIRADDVVDYNVFVTTIKKVCAAVSAELAKLKKKYGVTDTNVSHKQTEGKT